MYHPGGRNFIEKGDDDLYTCNIYETSLQCILLDVTMQLLMSGGIGKNEKPSGVFLPQDD